MVCVAPRPSARRRCLPLFLMLILLVMAAPRPRAAETSATSGEEVPAVQLDEPASAAAGAGEALQNATPTAAGNPSPVAPPDGGPPIVALLDFESTTLPQEQLDALSQALWSRLSLQGKLRMLPREETRAWLIRHDLHPGMPYAAPVPLPKVAQALRAAYVVAGRVDRIDKAWSLELTIQGADPAAKIQRADLQRATPEEMLEAMDWLAAQVRRSLQGQDLDKLIATAPTFTKIGEHAGEDAAATPGKKTATTSAKRKVAAAKPVEHEPSTKRAAPKRKTAPEPTEPADDLQPVPEAHEPTPAHEAAPEPAPAHEAPAARMTPAPQAAEPQPQATPAERVLAAGSSADTHATSATQPATHATPAPKKPTTETTPAVPEQADQARRLLEEVQALPVDDPGRIEKLERAASLAPKDALYPEKLANEYYRRGDFQQAMRATDRALKLKPNDTMLLTVKGSALYEMKDYAAARDAHQSALKADAKNNWARFNLALALTQLKSPEAAASWQSYLKEAASDPDQRDLLPEARRHLTALGGTEPTPPPAPAPPASGH